MWFRRNHTQSDGSPSRAELRESSSAKLLLRSSLLKTYDSPPYGGSFNWEQLMITLPSLRLTLGRRNLAQPLRGCWTRDDATKPASNRCSTPTESPGLNGQLIGEPEPPL